MMPPEAGVRQSLHDLPHRKAIRFRMYVIAADAALALGRVVLPEQQLLLRIGRRPPQQVTIAV